MQSPDTALVLIQHALTPVFLIVGIGTLLNSLTARLARIVDRVRWFDMPEAIGCKFDREVELTALARRMKWANAAINFLTGAAVVVCINIFLLVIEGYYDLPLNPYIMLSFVTSVGLLSLGMVCFFVEVSIATASLKVTKTTNNDDAQNSQNGRVGTQDL
ncbi:DUF2721 domain-containing protein [Glaciecola sp. SC05]|uniref:DUF2721 domain-containing protein n=1 Tax=Glaciecola sp. SC05 TaxID=1987355 RepID=UPI0035276E55